MSNDADIRNISWWSLQNIIAKSVIPLLPSSCPSHSPFPTTSSRSPLPVPPPRPSQTLGIPGVADIRCITDNNSVRISNADHIRQIKVRQFIQFECKHCIRVRIHSVVPECYKFATIKPHVDDLALANITVRIALPE